MEQDPLTNRESKKIPRPNLLDIVKIDGRLAQVIVGGDHIKYLDDESIDEINWDQYNFLKPAPHKTHVTDLVRENKISEIEYKVIRWGSEQEENPRLRDYVTFFGTYKKK